MRKLKKNKKIQLFIVAFISLLLLISIEWLYRNTGNLTIDQFIFHLKVPLQGTNSDMIWQYIIQVIPISIIISLAIMIVIDRYRSEGKAKRVIDNREL